MIVVDGAVVVRTERQAVAGPVVIGLLPGDNMRGFNEGEFVSQVDAEAAGSTRVVIEGQDGIAEGCIALPLEFFFESFGLVVLEEPLRWSELSAALL